MTFVRNEALGRILLIEDVPQRELALIRQLKLIVSELSRNALLIIRTIENLITTLEYQ